MNQSAHLKVKHHPIRPVSPPYVFIKFTFHPQYHRIPVHTHHHLGIRRIVNYVPCDPTPCCAAPTKFIPPPVRIQQYPRAKDSCGQYLDSLSRNARSCDSSRMPYPLRITGPQFPRHPTGTASTEIRKICLPSASTAGNKDFF